MTITKWWLMWATAAHLALKHGLFHLAEQLIGMAGFIVLATLENLHIHYETKPS